MSKESIKFIERSTGNIITENPPGEDLLKFLYHHPLGKLSLETVVKRKIISSIYGRMMDRKSSKNKIAGFVKDYNINMSESIKGVGDFSSFNDFFYRKLKPEARPIGEGLVSPGDGKLLAFERLNDLQTFFVKGEEFTIAKYLQNKELSQKFESSSILILRLAPNDYHRFHFPYAGTPKSPVQIKGAYYSVSPYAVTGNFARVFCENKRSYTILQTKDKGIVIISPVGATMVGSIIHTYDPEKSLNKGAEMGYFAFGGSTIVIFLEKNQFKIDLDLLENTNNGFETSVKMGEKIAI